MKLTLVAPIAHKRREKEPIVILPPTSVCAVAAVTPPEVTVDIVDESFEDIDFAHPTDLVGITAMTSTAPRAYGLAQGFRAQGKKVVLGGMHPSALPQEALQYADAVVVGEVEGIWPQVIADARADRLQGIYQASEPPLAEEIPAPRHDILKTASYLTTAVVQTSRGCPFGCEFCTVTQFFGQAYRLRPIQKVIQEIADFKERTYFIIDDNVLGIPQRAQELFGQMVGFGKRWIGQASLTGLREPGLLKLAARAGCCALFVGFETLSQNALNSFGKSFNVVERYSDAIARLHDAGIAVIASFMFGLEADTEATFEQTLKFAEKAKVDLLQMSILTPLPGTKVYEQMEQQGRIIDRDWSNYDGSHVVFQPRNLTPERLFDEFQQALRQAYSLRGIWQRLGLAGVLTRPVNVPLNLGFRARIKSYQSALPTIA